MSEEFEKRIMARFDDMDKRFDALENRMDSLENKMDVLENRMDSFENRLGVLEGDFGIFKKRLDDTEQTIIAKFNIIDVRLEKLEKDVSELKTNVSISNRRLSKVEVDIADLKEKMEQIHSSVVLIEHKVNKENPALFDGYLMHQENQELQAKQINSHDEKLNNHEIRIFTLEHHRTV